MLDLFFSFDCTKNTVGCSFKVIPVVVGRIIFFSDYNAFSYNFLTCFKYLGSDPELFLDPTA